MAPPPPSVEPTKEPEPEPGPIAESAAPWPPRPAEIGSWSIRWRQRWGELSNELEGQGVPFPESERRAYQQVKAEMEAS